LTTDATNWKGLKTFEVGRPTGAKLPPYKRTMALILAFMYVGFGLFLWILLKIFSKNRSKYNLFTVMFKWPIAFKALLNMLKSG